MDTPTAISTIARNEARRIRPLLYCDDRTLDELDADIGRRLPAFTIEKQGIGNRTRLVAVPLSHRDPKHDNAPRLEHLCSFLNRSVLPIVDPEAGLRGTFRVELHDSYSYLKNCHKYSNVFSFGRGIDASERHVALLPDPYHMDSFGGLVDRASQDPIPWSSKQPKLFFAGTTTGSRDAAMNERLRACAWGTTRPDLADIHVTHVAQMSMDSISAAWSPGLAHSMMGPYAPLEKHFEYRYILNIVGNTACWSRVPMIMSTKSLMVHVRHSDATWYYPLLREDRHYVASESTNGPDIERALRFCRSYDRLCKDIVKEANVLARHLFSTSAPAASYAAELLTECALLNN
jgi:hypothetical protein